MYAENDAFDRTVRARWDNAYLDGSIPWDTGITPPEVQTFWRSGLLPRTGLALDLGCGAGTNIAFLTALGLYAIGVDLSSVALSRARERNTGSRSRNGDIASLIQADVSRLPLSAFDASYILDIGCFHAISPAQRDDYVLGVIDNLAPGGFYHLFAHDMVRRSGSSDDELRGVGATEVEDRFSPHLSILSIVRGRPDPRPCRWYLLRRC